MRPSTLALTVFLPAALATGCLLPEAKAPGGTAVATGEPLAVVDDVKVWTTTSKEKVGETVIKDADGSTIGTADHYEERTQVHSMKVWYPVQGNAQVADEDFFRIAGDESALTATNQLRARGQKWNFRGKVTMGVSAIGLVAGFFIPNVAVKSTLVLGGTIGLSTGWYMAYWGSRQMDPETHAVDRSIAERAAHQYNAQLGVVGISAGTHF